MAWLTGWGFRKEITIQDTYVDSNLTNFPVYIRINNDADFHEAAADGTDIRFTQSDGETLLSYDRMYWTGGNGSAATAHFFVKVPSVLSTGGATIYCYYGKAGAADGEDENNVWDANFIAVWHMDDATTSTIPDYSGSGLTLSKKGANEPAVATTGPIYWSQHFDNTDDYAKVVSATLRITGDMTISCWVNFDEYDDASGNLFQNNMDWGDNEVRIYGSSPNNYIYTNGWTMSVAPDYTWTDGTTNMGSGTWRQVTLVMDHSNDTAYIYMDGAQVDSQALDASAVTVYRTDEAFILGAAQQDAGGDATPDGGWLDGQEAEVRVSNTARAAEWIKFEYHNVMEADKEQSWNAEETTPIEELAGVIAATSSMAAALHSLSSLRGTVSAQSAIGHWD